MFSNIAMMSTINVYKIINNLVVLFAQKFTYVPFNIHPIFVILNIVMLGHKNDEKCSLESSKCVLVTRLRITFDYRFNRSLVAISLYRAQVLHNRRGHMHVARIIASIICEHQSRGAIIRLPF